MIEENDLKELSCSLLTGITVGVGSLVLIFSSGASIIIQCPFEAEVEGTVSLGNGEDLSTAVLLFYFLNKKVDKAFFDNGLLILKFENFGCIKIISDKLGMESYVLTTRHGSIPVF